ncbi:sensor histidine kinase, partial [Nocardiopsis coralliicola]
AHIVAAGAAAALASALLAGLFASRAASRRAAALIDRLARLRADTLALARSELPAIVARLERGDQVDPDCALPVLDYGADEVGQVADAFTIAQRTAVRAAVRQADLRAGVSRVVLGIAHRDQSLVQRQLALLDRIEREEEDPDLLGDLFLLDHLATRGRRNAENLVILSGGRPGRRWHEPVPLVDVLRAAVSETEEYARVDVEEVPGLALSGAAVADVVHLLAELVDNATAFSPPHARVSIRTEPVPKGVVVEVEDRGLGMPEDALERANATLRTAPEFDVMALNRDLRLGLFVVARLAARHGAAVELCPSACGGTRAVVLLPAALTVAPPAAQGRSGPPTGPSAAMARSAAGRAAAAPAPAAAAPAGHPVRGIQAAAEQAPASAPDPAPADAAPEGTVRPALPRRRKQAGLAPQLRTEPNRSGPAPTAPEDARRMMEAFQSGTRRGRRDELEHMGESSD